MSSGSEKQAEIGAFGLPIRCGLEERRVLSTRVLQVQVVGAMGLPSKEKDGTSSPYVTLWLDKNTSQKYKTAIQRSTSTPSWDFERWTIRLPNNTSLLWIRVKDFDVGKKNDIM